MNEPKLPFEEKWRETFNNYAPQPEAGDWGGMEKLLQQQVPSRSLQHMIEDPLPPRRPILGLLKPTSIITWIIITLVAASLLFYFLGFLNDRDTISERIPPQGDFHQEVPLTPIQDSLSLRDTLIQLEVNGPANGKIVQATQRYRRAVRYDTVFTTDGAGNVSIGQIDTTAAISLPTSRKVITPEQAQGNSPFMATTDLSKPRKRRIRAHARLPFYQPPTTEQRLQKLLRHRFDSVRSPHPVLQRNNGYFPSFRKKY